MKGWILLFVLFFFWFSGLCQTYIVEYTFYSDHDDAPCYFYCDDKNTQVVFFNGSTALGSVGYISSLSETKEWPKITSLQLYSWRVINEYGTDTYSCGDPAVSVDISSYGDCYSFSTSWGTCATGYIELKVRPAIVLPEIPTKLYCSGSSIPLTGTPGYSSYTWQYQYGSGNWTTLRTTSGNATNVSLDDISGLINNQIVNFRYSIGNCDPNAIVSNVITGYSFLPGPVKITGYTAEKPLCAGTNEGSFTITSYSRGLVFGESYTGLNVYRSLSDDAISNSNTGLEAGTYYVVQETNFGGCGTLEDAASTIIIPSGPRTAVTSSASVTSLYNGSQIKCAGATDGEITITNPSGGNGSYKYFVNDIEKSSTINSLAAGTYNIRVVDTCPNTPNIFTTSVTISSPSPVLLTSLIPSDCNATTTSGAITINASGGTGALSFSLDDGAYESPLTRSGLSTGTTHIVIAKDVNECTSLPNNVIIPNPLTATSAVINPACGNGTGTIRINGANGGTGTYAYSLNGAAATGNNEFTSLPSGTNNVTLYDSKGCSLPFTNLTVIIPPLIGVTATTTQESCVGKNDGVISVSATNTNGIIWYSLNGGTLQTSNTFIGYPAGTYFVTLQDNNGNGCTGTSAPITIGRVPALTGSVNQTAIIRCFGDSGVKGATLDLSPSGGTPDNGSYAYTWTRGASTIATTQDVAGIGAGTYLVTITDKNLCSITLANITVSQPPLLTSSVTKTDVSCNPVHGVALSSNGSITLTPTGGVGAYQFLWSNNAVTKDLSGISAGAYSVRVTDGNGCITNNTATLIQPTAVSSTINSSLDVTCKGLNNGMITIAASGGTPALSYSRNGSNWQSSPVFTNLPPASYTILTRDQKGCTSSNTRTVTEPNLLVATVTDVVNTTCGSANGSAKVNVAGGNGGYQYTWRNSANQLIGTSNVLANVNGDAYTVIVTDQKNCADSKVALISNSDGATITVSGTESASCYDSRDGKAVITVSSAAAPYTITWSNNETGLSPIALLPGDNIVRVKDANNCAVVKSIFIPAPQPMTIDTQQVSPPTCAGSADASIALNMRGGNGDYTYLWSDGQTSASLFNVAAGDYVITVKDAKNCIFTSSLKIDPVPEIKLEVISSRSPTCFDGSDGMLAVNAIGGNGNYSYQWTNGPASNRFENVKAGQYTVKAMDVKGCNISSSFTLTNPAAFTFTLEDKTICIGQKFKIASEVIDGTYSWSSINGFSSTQREVILTEPDLYTLKVINAQGCIAQDNFVLKTSTDLLHADLLMISEAYQADTVVVIDLSWPLPEAISWIFPTQASVVEQNNELGYAFLKFNKAGQYDVAIRATLGECVDTYSQAIRIKEGGVSNLAGRQSSLKVIQLFEVYPNPNKGTFQIVTELDKALPVRLMLVNAEGNKIVVNRYEEGKDNYTWDFSFPDLTEGTYFLVLKAGKETKAIRMMKL